MSRYPEKAAFAKLNEYIRASGENVAAQIANGQIRLTRKSVKNGIARHVPLSNWMPFKEWTQYIDGEIAAIRPTKNPSIRGARAAQAKHYGRNPRVRHAATGRGKVTKFVADFGVQCETAAGWKDMGYFPKKADAVAVARDVADRMKCRVRVVKR